MTGETMVESARDVPRVLAAVVNYERSDLTARTLEDLCAQNGVSRLELVAIDNASSQAGRAELARLADSRAATVQLDTNRGYGAACNVAIDIAARRAIQYVWLLNNDLRVPPEVLGLLLAEMDADPQCAAAAAVTVDDLTGRTVIGAGVTVHSRRGIAHHLYQDAPVSALPSRPYPTGAVEASCLLVRVDAAKRVGGFDEGYFMYWEDTDWSLRARRLGYSLTVVPSARVRHLVAASSPPAGKTELMLRNRIRFVRACGSTLDQVTFLGYFLSLWLPAYTVARLIPRFGLRRGVRIARSAVAWNVADAVGRRRWTIRRPAGS
jgi:GT2 family glycosyltransferase